MKNKKKILSDLKLSLLKAFGNNIKDVILFGSQAYGGEKPDSDYDILLILKEKADLARETFKATNLENVIELLESDARDFLPNYQNISFCFLDAEKEVYDECYDLIIPNLVKGGILVADNAIIHYETFKPMIDKALTDERVDALIVPIGKGELVCRKI